MRTGYLLLFGIEYLDFSHKRRNGRKKGRHSRLSPSRQAQTGPCGSFRGVLSIDSFTLADQSQERGFMRQTSTCGAFYAKDRWHHYLIPSTMSFDVTSLFHITTSFGTKTSFRRRESSPSADHTIRISPPGIAVLYPSSLPGFFPFLETVSPYMAALSGFPPSRE